MREISLGAHYRFPAEGPISGGKADDNGIAGMYTVGKIRHTSTSTQVDNVAFTRMPFPGRQCSEVFEKNTRVLAAFHEAAPG